MRVAFATISVLWAVLCVAKLVLAFEDIDVFTTQNLDAFVNVYAASPCISIASLILIVFYYTGLLPPTSVEVSTVVTTVMTFGYLATWLSFGAVLTLVCAQNYVNLQELHAGLLPYAFIDCILICVQFAMIAREASWFLMTKRAELTHMEQGPPLSTLINSIIFLAIATSILQVIKILVIGIHWPLTNDATSVFGLLSAIFTLCNMILYTTYHTSFRFDVVQGTAALVLFSMASLLIWGSIGSSIVMMDFESKESYQMLFAIDLMTGVTQIVGIALLQYIAHNLHAERS